MAWCGRPCPSSSTAASGSRWTSAPADAADRATRPARAGGGTPRDLPPVRLTSGAGSDGIRWIVNPSTRPVVRSHPYEKLRDKPYRKKVIEGGPIDPNGHRDHKFVLNGPADVFRTSLDWPTPDDLDREVYRKTSDGKLRQVGSSGKFVGDKERVDPNGAPVGTYVLRMINFARGGVTRIDFSECRRAW